VKKSRKVSLKFLCFFNLENLSIYRILKIILFYLSINNLFFSVSININKLIVYFIMLSPNKVCFDKLTICFITLSPNECLVKLVIWFIVLSPDMIFLCGGKAQGHWHS
jgi:hypothetical protein